MSRITFGLRLVSPFKPYSRVAEDSVFCFFRVAAVVVVVVVLVLVLVPAIEKRASRMV